MGRMMMLVMLPLVALVWLAGPVGGVWLVILGDWWALGYALLSLVSAHFLLAFALAPTFVFAAPAASVGDRRPRLSVVLLLPIFAYTAGLITVWCVGVLLFFLSRSTADNWVPLSLLAFSVGTGPWMYMASKEAEADPGSGSDGSALATLFMTLAFGVVLVMLAFDRTRPARDLWLGFGTVMVAYVCFAGWMAWLRARRGY